MKDRTPPTQPEAVHRGRTALRRGRRTAFAAGTAASLTSALLVCGVAGAPAADAATSVDYTTRKIMGLGDAQIHVPTLGVGAAATSGYGSANGMALDAVGNLYIADPQNNVIEMVTPGGDLSIFAGGHGTHGTSTPALNATLDHPVAVAISSTGDMYVATANDSRIRKIVMSTGAISVVAGDGSYNSSSSQLPTLGVVATTTSFADLYDLAVDEAGNIFVADGTSILRIDHATDIVTQVVGPPDGYAASGTYPTSTPQPALGAYLLGLREIAVGRDGSLYATALDSNNNAALVFKVSTDGNIRRIAGNGTAADMVDGAALSSPLEEGGALRVDSGGNVYVGAKHQVAKIDPSGDLEVIAGAANASNTVPATFDVASLSSTFFEVDALALGADGSVHVSNGSPRYIEKLVNHQPGLPIAASATAGVTAATVTWSAATAGSGGAVTGYTITPYAAGVAQTPVNVGPSTTTHTATGLTAGTPYTFRIAATSSAGSGDTTVTLPVTPTAAPVSSSGPSLSEQTLTVSAPSSVSLSAGTARVTATASAGGALTYTSSTPEVASIDSSGTVILKGAGTTTITVTAAATTTHRAASTSTTLTVTAPPTTTLPTGTTRLAGSDRVATAAAVSQQVFADPDAGKSANAVIATSAGFADSIAGTRLAGQVQGPLLLTGTNELDSKVAAEVRRLVKKGGTVYVLGQTQALSATVQNALRSLSDDYALERLGGTDRYETAAAIADEVTSHAGDTGPIYLVTGKDFADGVSVGAHAQRTGGVVILTDGNTLPAVSAAYLKDHDPTGTRLVPVGGAAKTAAATAGLDASRAVVGADRFDTSAKLAQQYADLKTAANTTGKVTNVGIAGGTSWPDALAGAAAMAHLDGPLLLTPTAGSTLPSSTSTALGTVGADAERAVVFGGPAAVSDTVLTQIKTRAR